MKRINTKELTEFLEPISDKLTDSVTKEVFGTLAETVKAEPTLKIALMLLQAPKTASDAIFRYKFSKFISSGKINKNDLDKINKKLSRKNKVRFWRLIFTSVQSHDDEKRTELVSKVVAAFSADKINYEEMMAMIHASNRVNVDNLHYLLSAYQGEPGTMPPYVRQEFLTVGLFGMEMVPSGIGVSGGTTYPLTDLGWKYVGALYQYPEYKNKKELRIGEGRLIGCKKTATESHRETLPFDEAVEKGYWYGIAAVVARDENKIWMKGQNPVVVSVPIYAGEYGERALANLTGLDESNFSVFFSANNDTQHVTIFHYLLDRKFIKRLFDKEGSWVDFRELIRRDIIRDLADAILKHDAALAQKEGEAR